MCAAAAVVAAAVAVVAAAVVVVAATREVVAVAPRSTVGEAAAVALLMCELVAT